MSSTKDTLNEISNVADKLHFKFLPDYAQYILDNKIDDFVHIALKTSYEVDIPILRFFKELPEEELFKLYAVSNQELLQYFAENSVKEFIDISMGRWVDNQLPLIQNDEVVARDFTTISFVRRKCFRDLLPDYTSDINLYNQILEEVDTFIMVMEESSYTILFNIKQKKINENHYFIEKINNTSPGIINVFDLQEQKEIYSNHKRKEMLGFTDEEIKEMGGDVLAQILHPDDLPAIIEHRQTFSNVSDGEIRIIEYRVRNKAGIYRWRRGYETVFKRTDKGVPSQIIGIALDISKEKEAVKQLEYREQQLSEAQEIAGLGSFEWDLVEGYSIFSPQLLRIFDLEDKSTPPTFLEFVHPTDRPKLREALDRAINGGETYECEYRYNKSGTEKVVWSRGVVTFEKGKPMKMRGTVLDVTQRHDMLKQLERNVELYKQAQALTHIGNWSWYIAENKINWSDEMYRIYGLVPQSEEIGFERFILLVHPEDREKRLAEIQQALETHHAQDYVMRILCADGTVKVLQGKGEVLIDEDNKPYKLVGTCQDVTQQHFINQQLQQHRDELAHKNIELQQSNEELSSFNYIASHDLQEPLRKIKIFTNRILEKDYDTLTNAAKEFLPRIITSATQMQTLINDLLAFSRATSADRVFEPTDMNLLLEEVRSTLKENISEKKVHITSSNLPTLNLIPFQFQQLLENIIGNAIKYSKADISPEINITSAIVSGKHYVAEGSIPEKKYHKISITDNGIGFDQEYAQKIFELFQRLHGKSEYSGTGIGLAICKKIIQNHNGFINALSKEGQGSTFNIFIPIDK